MQCKVTMLYVGQGAMSLIETHDDQGNLTNLTLMDCGSENSSYQYAYSLEYVKEKIRERGSQVGKDMFLDTLVISHCDKDHWSLLTNLLPGLYGGLWEKNGEIFFYRYGENYQETFVYTKNLNSWKRSISATGNFQMSLLFFFGQISDYINMKYSDGDCTINIDWMPKTSLMPNFFSGSVVYSQESIKLISYKGQIYRRISLDQLIPLTSVPETVGDLGKLCLSIILSVIKEFGELAQKLNNNYPEILKLINLPYMTQEEIIEQFIERKDQMREAILIGTAHIGGNVSLAGIQFNDVSKKIGRHSLHVYYEWNQLQNISSIQDYELIVVEKLPVHSRLHVDHAKSWTSSIKKNATSLVAVFNDGTTKVVFPGDATVHTFFSILCKLYNAEIGDGYKNILQCADWLAPHHGAIATITGTFTEDKTVYEVFPVFIRDVQVEKMCISAGAFNKHHHPRGEFVDMMRDYYAEKGDSAEIHTIYYYNQNNRFDILNMPYSLYTHSSMIPSPYCISPIQEEKKSEERRAGQRPAGFEKQKIPSVKDFIIHR